MPATELVAFFFLRVVAEHILSVFQFPVLCIFFLYKNALVQPIILFVL